MKRDLRLDVIKCIMNYMIVLLHAWAAFQYVPRGTIEFGFWTFICSHVCSMALPTFFLISGWLLFKNYSLSAYPKKMASRLRRLFVPYVCWNLTFVAFYLTMARFVPRLAVRVSTFGLGTFWGAFSKVLSLTVNPIDGPLWFVRTLLLISIASPILWFLMRFKKGVVLLSLAVAWVALERTLGLSSLLQMVCPSYALFCVSLGGVLAMNEKDLVATFRAKWWIAVGFAACCVQAYFYMALDRAWRMSFVGTLLNKYVSILEAPALLAVVACMPAVRIAENGIYQYLQRMSFFAYAGHFLFCSMLLHTLVPFLAFMTTGKFTVLILIFVGLGVPLMAGVYGLGRKLCPKALKLWDGSL